MLKKKRRNGKVSNAKNIPLEYILKKKKSLRYQSWYPLPCPDSMGNCLSLHLKSEPNSDFV